ncbi:hypothetical protein IWW38_003371, partial [Coemansia aciculifera]
FAQPALPNDAHIVISRRAASFDYVRPLQVQPSSALRTKSLDVVASRAALLVEESVPETVRAMARAPSAVPRQKLCAEDLALKHVAQPDVAEDDVEKVLPSSHPQRDSSLAWRTLSQLEADDDEEWSYHMQRSSTIFWRDLARALVEKDVADPPCLLRRNRDQLPAAKDEEEAFRVPLRSCTRFWHNLARLENEVDDVWPSGLKRRRDDIEPEREVQPKLVKYSSASAARSMSA